MNRNECEQAIREHMENIVEALHQYAPNCQYLTLAYITDEEDSSIMFNNRCHDEDADAPINFHCTYQEPRKATYTEMLNWIAEHEQVKEDFLKAFPGMTDRFEEDN